MDFNESIMPRKETVDIYFGKRKEQCWVCKRGAPLICCDNCPNTFHEQCVYTEHTNGDIYNCGMCQIAGQDTPEHAQFKNEHKGEYLRIKISSIVDVLSSPNYRRIKDNSHSNVQNPGYRNLAVQKRRFTSTYRGVYCRSGKWNAQIQCSGTKIYLGSFPNEVQAAIAYDLAAVKLHRDKAVTNFIKPGQTTDQNGEFDQRPMQTNSIPTADQTFSEYSTSPESSPEPSYDSNYTRELDCQFKDITLTNGIRPRKRRNIKEDDIMSNDETNLSEVYNSTSPNHYMRQNVLFMSTNDGYNPCTTECEDTNDNRIVSNEYNTTNTDGSTPGGNSDDGFCRITNWTKDLCITDQVHVSPLKMQTDDQHIMNNCIDNDLFEWSCQGNNCNNTNDNNGHKSIDDQSIPDDSIDEYNNVINITTGINNDNDISSFSNANIYHNKMIYGCNNINNGIIGDYDEPHIDSTPHSDRNKDEYDPSNEDPIKNEKEHETECI